MRAALLLALIGTAQAVVMTRRRIGAAASAGLAAQLAPPAHAADADLLAGKCGEPRNYWPSSK